MLDAYLLEEIAQSAGNATGCHIYVDARNLLPSGPEWNCPGDKADEAYEFLGALRNDEKALSEYINKKGELLRCGKNMIRKIATVLPNIIFNAAFREE